MLPGIRFLVAAIVLSMSLLIFGLGAAALLRAAHEEFASNPSWRATPEVTFAQSAEPTTPMLAALHVELPAATTPQDIAPATAAQPEETAAAPASASTESGEQIAAQKPEETSLPQAGRLAATTMEVPVAENAPAAQPAPVLAEKPAATEEAPIAAVATSETLSRDDLQLADRSGQVNPQPAPAADGVTTNIATLGGPAVNIESPPKAKISAAKPDTAKADQRDKRAQAKQASRRKIAAARAKLVAQQVQQAQLQPFQVQPVPFLQQPAQTARVRKVKRNQAGPVATGSPPS
jgi:hypothetical protein